MDVQKTFCLLTPAGRSAVATTRVHSYELLDDLSTLFLTQSGRPVVLKPLKPQFGFWKYPSGNTEGLVACLIDDQTVEIHSHGGELAPRLIAQSLCEKGFTESTELPPIESLQESIWRSEIRHALSRATTRKTALVLLELLGVVDEKIAALAQLLSSKPQAAVTSMEQALSLREFGLHLTKPWSIVICGQPNVGKSSLINAVSGFARAIVHDSPGTTRDVVTEITAFQGWPVELKDTAGIRETDQQIESEGVRRARSEFEKADLRIGMFDGSQPWSPNDQQILDELEPQIVVHNKFDQQIGDSNRPDGMWISALTGEGIEELIERVVQDRITPVPNSELFPINAAQVQRLEQAIHAIQTLDPEEGGKVALQTLLGSI